jgi:hypothetical protein
MISDEDLEAALENAIEEAVKEIEASKWCEDINPLLAKDHNGRFLLIDAYSALANFRATRRLMRPPPTTIHFEKME